MQRKASYVNSEIGEEMTIGKLIVMNDVSGFADKSDIFSNFLRFLENVVFLAYIFFIVFIQTDKLGNDISNTHI